MCQVPSCVPSTWASRWMSVPDHQVPVDAAAGDDADDDKDEGDVLQTSRATVSEERCELPGPRHPLFCIFSVRQTVRPALVSGVWTGLDSSRDGRVEGAERHQVPFLVSLEGQSYCGFTQSDRSFQAVPRMCCWYGSMSYPRPD